MECSQGPSPPVDRAPLQTSGHATPDALERCRRPALDEHEIECAGMKFVEKVEREIAGHLELDERMRLVKADSTAGRWAVAKPSGTPSLTRPAISGSNSSANCQGRSKQSLAVIG